MQHFGCKLQSIKNIPFSIEMVKYELLKKTFYQKEFMHREFKKGLLYYSYKI